MKKYFLILCIFIASCGDKVKVQGTIMEKAVISYKTSYEYRTIIQTDDGFIEDVTGPYYYSKPIGSRVTVEVVRFK